MGMRVHTTTAKSVAVKFCRTSEIIALFGEEFEGTSAGLVIEDGGNMEALILQGSTGDMVDFAHAILRDVQYTIDEDNS